MGYINIFVNNKAKLTIKNNQLFLQGETKQADYPLEDVNCVMIDNPNSAVSFATLSKLAEYGILTYVCNDSHLPNGVMLPYYNHYQTLAVYNKQIAMSKPLQKSLWQTIIKNKIQNQNIVLNLLGHKDKLKFLANNVLSGDTTNNEAKASAIYFKLLFGKDFSRKNDKMAINSMLNYGYAIVRGIVARSVVCHGLLPFLGIFHHNQFNQFNLADDLIEVFRPLVDLFVSTELKDRTELDSKTKFSLCDLINYDVIFDGKKQTLNNAVDMFVESFSKSINLDLNLIKSVAIFGLNRHIYE